MPYIKQERRDKFDDKVNDLLMDIDSDGELNYIITSLVLGHYQLEKYLDYEQALGLLEAVKLEFYRRSFSKFEDQKIASNGDVFIGGAS
jgi:hypothetical protein